MQVAEHEDCVARVSRAARDKLVARQGPRGPWTAELRDGGERLMMDECEWDLRVEVNLREEVNA